MTAEILLFAGACAGEASAAVPDITSLLSEGCRAIQQVVLVMGGLLVSSSTALLPPPAAPADPIAKAAAASRLRFNDTTNASFVREVECFVRQV